MVDNIFRPTIVIYASMAVNAVTGRRLRLRLL